MKKDRSANVISFTWGSLPVDALDQQTMRDLQIIATREGTTIENVMSKALDWTLARSQCRPPATN